MLKIQRVPPVCVKGSHLTSGCVEDEDVKMTRSDTDEKVTVSAYQSSNRGRVPLRCFPSEQQR